MCMKAKKPVKPARTRGRPSDGLSEVLYIRVTPEQSARIAGLLERERQKTGYKLSMADLVRRIFFEALKRHH